LQDSILYAARHGQTTLNAKNCFRGPIDVPLDAQGYRDAHALAYWFEPIELSYIFSSSRTRALDTAKIIGDRHPEVEIIPNDGLWAWNVGDFAGKPKDEYAKQFQFYVDHPDVTVPGGEALNDFKARIRPLYREGIEVALRTALPVLFVVHSSVIHELGSLINSDHHSTLVKPGGAAAVDFSNGVLRAHAVFKPLKLGSGADTIS